jgi:hypothetical protein
MKKIMFLALSALLLAACEGPMGPPGPAGLPGAAGHDGHDGQDGRDGQNGKDGEGTHWIREEFVVQPGDWVLNGGVNDMESFYSCTFKWNELTQHIYENGAVVAYIENGAPDGPSLKNGMPYVWHRGKVIDGQTYEWTETYDFDFRPEWITFYCTYSDFETGELPDRTRTFHVVLLYDN